MPNPLTRRGISLVAPAALCLAFALSACASTGTAGTAGGNLSTQTPTSNPPATTAPPSTPPTTAAPSPTQPANYFANGKTYDAWVLSINSDGTVTINLVHHLTGQDAKDYLTSHGQTIPPDGIPNDYINVDTYVQKKVSISSSATVTTNPQGLAKSMTEAAFMSSYLPTNLGQPIAPADRDKYPGAAHYFGALYALTFQNDVIVSVDQIFEP